MRVLLDSNILLRLASASHPMHTHARGAVAALQRSGATIQTVPQNFYEFWVVATRPVAVNGLGMSASEASAELTRLQSLFPILPDSPTVFTEWQSLVTVHNIVGKNAHDARLVAAMVCHGVTHIITINTSDFIRYVGITVLDAAAVASTPGTP
jgi:predicted nucleic acid-binding protein